MLARIADTPNACVIKLSVGLALLHVVATYENIRATLVLAHVNKFAMLSCSPPPFAHSWQRLLNSGHRSHSVLVIKLPSALAPATSPCIFFSIASTNMAWKWSGSSNRACSTA